MFNKLEVSYAKFFKAFVKQMDLSVMVVSVAEAGKLGFDGTYAFSNVFLNFFMAKETVREGEMPARAVRTSLASHAIAVADVALLFSFPQTYVGYDMMRIALNMANGLLAYQSHEEVRGSAASMFTPST